jgi:protein TonB
MKQSRRSFSMPRVTVMLITLMVASLIGCSASKPVANTDRKFEPLVETTRDGTSTARTVTGYKEDIAHRIAETSSTKVYIERPQALLRSVIVLKFVIDANGRLVRSDISRSNHDSATETTAVASLRNAAPFPKPPANLLQNGRIELSETWLFNNDGRFQLRSIAQPQMNE